MSKEKPNTIKFKFYEYILYWIASGIVLLLAIPIIILKFFLFLIRATGAPLQSVRNLLGFILVLLLLSAGYIIYEIYTPIDLGSEKRSLIIDEAAPFHKIAGDLQKGGLIKSRHLFRMAAIISHIDTKILPGRYDFTGRVSLYDVLHKFKRQEIATLLLTFPEGLTIYKTASLLAANLQIDSTSFVARAVDTAFTRYKYNIDGLEGYLFPETYLFWYGIRIDGIIDMMLTQFHRQTAGIFDSLLPDCNSVKDVLTLASIIEAEAGNNEEMPLISSVYHNRLRDKILLQADPTILYALGGLRRPLTHEDLNIISPYNTYNNGGLPPGPINSPGLAAIKAALHPARTDYGYFVANGSGRHIFSRTLAEHNQARYKVKVLQKVLKKN
ncbi:MAG: endolytic transglycosylase MltG [candidate division Zixibacteria bacterium]|nr:endolytic transglycosylase MltG [candidate division Zixibacteria bacterium]